MKSISNELRTALYSKNLISYPYYAHVYYVTYPNEYEIPQISNIQINLSDGNFCNSASFEVVNVNPNNMTDFGYFNASRNDTLHLKPMNAWYDILKPGLDIRIYVEMNEEISSIFYGTIYNLTTEVDTSGSKLKVQCYDLCKRRLQEASVHRIDSSATPTLQWSIIYPLSATDDHIYLDESDTNPSLESIIIDICMRAGWSEAHIHVDPTYMNLSDLPGGMLEWTDVTWDKCINDIIDITVFDFHQDSDGELHFTYPKNRTIAVANEGIVFTKSGDPEVFDPIALSEKTAANIIVKDNNNPATIYYDWDFNPAMNTITPREGGDIAKNCMCLIDYNHINWTFKNGINVKTLPVVFSHEQIYGRIKVTGIDTDINYIATLPSAQLWDGSTINEYKLLETTNQYCLDEAACHVVADKLMEKMIDKYISIPFEIIPLPQMELKDLLHIDVYGFCSDVYEVNSINLNWSPNLKMDINVSRFDSSPISEP